MHHSEKADAEDDEESEDLLTKHVLAKPPQGRSRLAAFLEADQGRNEPEAIRRREDQHASKQAKLCKQKLPISRSC